MTANNVTSLLMFSLFLGLCSAAAPSVFHLLVVREDCWAPYFVNFSWLTVAGWTSPSSILRDCVSASITKALGYGIILGSCVVKLPQVINIVRSRSGAGLSLASQYQELASNALAVIWHATWNRSPFSAYGETIIVTLGCALVVVAMWAFERPSTSHVAIVLAASAVLVQFALTSPSVLTGLAASMATAVGVPGAALSTAALKDVLQFASQLTFWGARITQIIATARERSNGAQSPLTLVFNLMGTAARVFTSFREVGDRLQLAFTVFNVFLNGVLCAQYVAFAGAKPKVSSKAKEAKEGKAKEEKAKSGKVASSPSRAKSAAKKRL
jgi:mannose-P-dolichol utilization defect protein 1